MMMGDRIDIGSIAIQFVRILGDQQAEWLFQFQFFQFPVSVAAENVDRMIRIVFQKSFHLRVLPDGNLKKGSHGRTDAGRIEEIDLAADQDDVLEIERDRRSYDGAKIIEIIEMIQNEMLTVMKDCFIFLKDADAVAVFFGGKPVDQRIIVSVRDIRTFTQGKQVRRFPVAYHFFG
jgi:hypothetical protein